MRIPLFKCYYDDEMAEASKEVLASGSIAGGKYVALLENSLAETMHQQHFLLTDNFTNAMELALQACGVVEGDEVLTVAFSCMASNSPIATLGATPVWVDFEPDSVQVDLDKFESLITERTRAAIVYHVAGYPAAIKDIANICQKRNIKLIEDCNNAMFSSYSGTTVGSFGDVAVYSFYPNRLINAVDGGAISFASSEMAAHARRFLKFGIDQTSFRDALGEINPDSDIPAIGRTIGMNNLYAGLGYTQFKTVNQRISQIENNASYLETALSDLPQVNVIRAHQDADTVNWVFLIQIKKRDTILADLKAKGIHVSKLHQLNSVYSGFREHPSRDDLPNAVNLQATILALPCGWWLTKDDLVNIVASLREAIEEHDIGTWLNE